jgi:hypothetical protein
MKTLDELYRNLEKYKDFDENDENCIKFLETVDEIVIKKDTSSVPVLLSYFNDESEYSWVFEELIGAVEYYEKDIYIKYLIENIFIMKEKSINYLKSLLFHIMNSPLHLSTFEKHMHLADRDSLLKLFDLMEKESPHHAPLIQELRRELLKNP